MCKDMFPLRPSTHLSIRRWVRGTNGRFISLTLRPYLRCDIANLRYLMKCCRSYLDFSKKLTASIVFVQVTNTHINQQRGKRLKSTISSSSFETPGSFARLMVTIFTLQP